MGNMARLLRGGKRVVIVVQRGLLLVDGLAEHVQAEGHLGDVHLEQGVTPPLFFLLLLSSILECCFTHFDFV